MKVWEHDGYVRIHPFLSQDQESEFQFAYFVIDTDDKAVYLSPIDKDYRWDVEKLEQYKKGLEFAIKELSDLVK